MTTPTPNPQGDHDFQAPDTASADYLRSILRRASRCTLPGSEAFDKFVNAAVLPALNFSDTETGCAPLEKPLDIEDGGVLDLQMVLAALLEKSINRPNMPQLVFAAEFIVSTLLSTMEARLATLSKTITGEGPAEGLPFSREEFRDRAIRAYLDRLPPQLAGDERIIAKVTEELSGQFDEASNAALRSLRTTLNQIRAAEQLLKDCAHDVGQAYITGRQQELAAAFPQESPLQIKSRALFGSGLLDSFSIDRADVTNMVDEMTPRS